MAATANPPTSSRHVQCGSQEEPNCTGHRPKQPEHGGRSKHFRRLGRGRQSRGMTGKTVRKGESPAAGPGVSTHSGNPSSALLQREAHWGSFSHQLSGNNNFAIGANTSRVGNKSKCFHLHQSLTLPITPGVGTTVTPFSK